MDLIPTPQGSPNDSAEPEEYPLDRRSFIKWGATSLAAFAARPAWCAPNPNDAAARREPAEPIVLRSTQVEVVLDRRDALPYSYRIGPDRVLLKGEDSGTPIHLLLCDRGQWEFVALPVTASSVKTSGVKTSGNQADFNFQVTREQKPAVDFVLRYRLDGSTLHFTLEEVREHSGYELIEVEIPALVTAREEDGPAWLAHGDSGGSLVSLSEATPGSLAPNSFWGNVSASLPVVMIGTDRVACIQEVGAYMDGTRLSVAGESGHRRASLGTVKVHRVNGSLAYDMNTGTGTPRISGNRNTPNLLVGQTPSCRLDFITAEKGKMEWIAGAKLVRQRMPAIPTHYYDDKLVYGIHCDEPTWEKPGATFEQCQELIQRVSALTDNSPQVVHLWGWQYRGKDTGYPAVAEINKRVGTYDGLLQLMGGARQFNCNVTFSDNYDDAYKSSPAWDPQYIARRPDGELWQSRSWTGENSYIIGLAKYMHGPGLERVRYTCERYQLRNTTHVDVLSYYSIRNDWDPSHPASGIQNLEARYKVVEEFARHGVDVSSEALRYAFIGKVSSFWHMPTPTPCPFGGKPIPLLPTIYRQSALWGEWGRSRSNVDRILNMLFYNACPHLSIGINPSPGEITDLFYLMMVPWFKLQNRKVEQFLRDGERTTLTLEGNTLIDLDWKAKTYKVTIDGVEIARDASTFCPINANRIAFYSSSAKELSLPLPQGWKADDISARLLATAESKPFPVVVEGGQVRANVPAQQPVIVYRDKKAANPHG